MWSAVNGGNIEIRFLMNAGFMVREIWLEFLGSYFSEYWLSGLMLMSSKMNAFLQTLFFITAKLQMTVEIRFNKKGKYIMSFLGSDDCIYRKRRKRRGNSQNVILKTCSRSWAMSLIKRFRRASSSAWKERQRQESQLLHSQIVFHIYLLLFSPSTPHTD